MGEPALDLSEIVDLYKEDARRMIGQMRNALAQWSAIPPRSAAGQDLRRLSHQLRGSGRTYGFRNVTRVSKAIEEIILKVEKNKLPANDRTQEAIRKKIERLAEIFAS